MVYEWLDLQEEGNVLDVASGLGYHCCEIAKDGCDVYGLDINRENTRLSKKITAKLVHKPQYVTGNAETLPFKNHILNKVICVCALEHIEDDVQALREINRVLKSNGVLVLTVESWTGKVNSRLKPIAADYYDVKHFYSLPLITQLLNRAGFKVVESRFFLNSPISRVFHEIELELHHYSLPKRLRLGLILGFLFFPLTYVLGTISDHFWGNPKAGYELAIRAIKV